MGPQAITLDRYLKARGKLPAPVVARIAVQVARDLARQEKAAPGGEGGVVHPGRIAVAPGGAARLLPLPRARKGPAVEARFAAYLAPEVIRGGPGDLRSSLYSLGCTLFELLTGRPPFPGATPREVLKHHLQSPVPDPRPAGEVPEALAAVVRDLLAKDPAQRLPSARHLLARLQGSESPAAGKRRRARVLSRSAAARPTVRMDPLEAAAASPRAPGTPRGASAPAGGARHPSRRRGLPGRALERYLDEEGRPIARKRSFLFTAIGAALGLVISSVVVMRTVGEVRMQPARKQAALARIDKERIERRKEGLRAAFGEERQRVERVLEKLRKMAADPALPGDYVRGIAAEELKELAGVPGSVALADEVLKLHSEARLQEERRQTGSEEEFRAGLGQVEKLWQEDRWGQALQMLRDLEFEHGKVHEREIDAEFDRRAKELEQRWEADKRKIQELAGQGEVHEALRIASAAVRYGDERARKEAAGLEEEIRSQAVRPAGEPPAQEKDAGSEEEAGGAGQFPEDLEKGLDEALEDGEGGSG